LNRAANLRKELRQMLEEWIESEVAARLSRWVLECRREQNAGAPSGSRMPARADKDAGSSLGEGRGKAAIAGEVPRALESASSSQGALFDAFDSILPSTVPLPGKPPGKQRDRPDSTLAAQHQVGLAATDGAPCAQPGDSRVHPRVDCLATDAEPFARPAASALRQLEKVARHHARELQYSLYNPLGPDNIQGGAHHAVSCDGRSSTQDDFQSEGLKGHPLRNKARESLRPARRAEQQQDLPAHAPDFAPKDLFAALEDAQPPDSPCAAELSVHTSAGNYVPADQRQISFAIPLRATFRRLNPLGSIARGAA